MSAVGREAELAAVDEFLNAVRARSTTLAITGAPGIGKSTIFDAALAVAAQQRFRVLVARPAEVEQHAAWSALADLLDGIDHADYANLPAPQQHALDAALLLAEPAAPVPPRATWFALRSVLTELATDGPLLVAVDDAHWLDPDSAAAVSFVSRRLPPAGVGVLLTSRRDTPAEHTLDLAVLPPDVIGQLIHEHLDVVLPPATLARLYETCAGNPLFALELAKFGHPVPGTPPRLPDTLHQLVADRIEAAPATTRATLVAIASAARPSVSVLTAAGLDEGLPDAETARLVRVDGLRVAFTHPLLGAAAYHSAPSDVRRAVHARLAKVTDAEEAARHRALAASAPDAEVAAVVEAAAVRAARRGAPGTAAELADLAVRLTPDGDAARWRRRLVAGEQLFLAGDAEEAVSVLRAVRAEAADPDVVAEAAYLLADVSVEVDVGAQPLEVASEALALAGHDPARRARAMVTRVYALYSRSMIEAATQARAALAIALDLPDPEPGLLASALVASAATAFESGSGVDRAGLARAEELEALSVPPRVASRAIAVRAVLLKYSDDFAGARAGFAEVRRLAEEEGDESSLPFVLSHLPQLESWTGRWDEAEAAAREHLAVAQRVAAGSQLVRQAEINLAQQAALRGDGAEARRLGLALVDNPTSDRWDRLAGHAVVGLAASYAADFPAAATHLDAVAELADALGLQDPGRNRWQADHVEALIAVGERDRAVAALSVWEGHARRLDRVSSLASAARCRALLADTPDTALEFVAESLAQYDRVDIPFDRARTLLVAGRVHRRAKHKRAAREALTAAREIFARLGARQYVARVGLRQSGSELTPTESRVVELAARGLTTREMAEQLFLSTKTVEANLTRIYRKLNLRSRADLANWHRDQV